MMKGVCYAFHRGTSAEKCPVVRYLTCSRIYQPTVSPKPPNHQHTWEGNVCWNFRGPSMNRQCNEKYIKSWWNLCKFITNKFLFLFLSFLLKSLYINVTNIRGKGSITKKKKKTKKEITCGGIGREIDKWVLCRDVFLLLSIWLHLIWFGCVWQFRDKLYRSDSIWLQTWHCRQPSI